MVSYHYQRQYTPIRRPHHRSGNPYFRSRSADRLAYSRVNTTASRLSFKSWLLIIGSVVLLGGIVWLAFISPYLTISTVVITGTGDSKARELEKIVWQQTEERRWWVIPQNHLLAFDRTAAKKRVEEVYILADLKFKKKLLHTLHVQVTEKPPALVWFENDSYYVIDQEGWVLEQVTAPSSTVPVVYNNAAPSVIDRHLDDQSSVLIKPAVELNNLLHGQFAYLKAKQITVNQEKATLVVVLQGGQLIYVATDQSLTAQFDKLDTLVKTQLKNHLTGVDYIDLRFGDKIYYK